MLVYLKGCWWGCWTGLYPSVLRDCAPCDEGGGENASVSSIWMTRSFPRLSSLASKQTRLVKSSQTLQFDCTKNQAGAQDEKHNLMTPQITIKTMPPLKKMHKHTQSHVIWSKTLRSLCMLRWLCYLITLMFIFEETSDSSAPSHTEQNDVILEKDFFIFFGPFFKAKCCLRK